VPLGAHRRPHCAGQRDAQQRARPERNAERRRATLRFPVRQHRRVRDGGRGGRARCTPRTTRVGRPSGSQARSTTTPPELTANSPPAGSRVRPGPAPRSATSAQGPRLVRGVAKPTTAHRVRAQRSE
jgi:hypothetical protein